MSKFKQGFYKIIYPFKYIQPADKTMNKEILPKYRSSWELKFFKFCDSNPLIYKWSSEPFAIPYFNPVDGKMHRYFVDGYIEFKSGDKFIVEVKPFSQTKPPVQPKRKTEKAMQKFNFDVSTFLINSAKWDAAKIFAAKNNLKFIILTEKELGIK